MSATTKARLRIRLAGPTDFAGFRAAARHCLAAGTPPNAVEWEADEGDSADLFGGGVSVAEIAARKIEVPRPVPHVSADFLDLAESAALHRAPYRYGLIYRLLWRLGEEPRLLSLASDSDVRALHDRVKAVRRDIHKMHAFVRFRVVERPEGGEAYIAWYEPDHRIVEAASPFFAKRFASLVWSILTPERSAHWTGARLVFGPGAARDAAPREDGLEDLWLGYYASTFNPARVNPRAMKAEMPVRFWKNLPEAQLIAPLLASAPARTREMIARAPTLPVARRGATLPDPVREGPPALAPDAGDLARLPAELAGCRACPLWEPATRAVPGEGPADAALMIVGEQPGDAEDIAGRPFVGPAGRLLDTALAEAGVARPRVYVTNAVKHFKFAPRGKKRLHKTPDVREIQVCRSWLDREFAAVSARVVVLLGASAARAVLGESVAVTKMRGQPLTLADGRIALLATHPAYVLRLAGEAEKRRAYEALVADLRLAASLIGQEAA